MVAEHPCGDEHEIDVAELVEDLVDEGTVTLDVRGLELDGLDDLGPCDGRPLTCLAQPPALSAGQHDGPAARCHQAVDDSLGDFGGAAEDEHRLRAADSVDHDRFLSGLCGAVVTDRSRPLLR